MIPVLSIAGSDPSGGAGIQADLKTFCDHGVYGMAVITALTAQNTRGVQRVLAVDPELLAAQLDAVLTDIPPAAIKVGMLGTAAGVQTVARLLRDYRGPVVLDPVLVSTSGARLLAVEAQRSLLTELLPLATVVTPNLPEAAVILGADPTPPASLAWAQTRGVALLLTDGHGDGSQVIDQLFLPDGRQLRMAHPRLRTRNSHGTGCTLSSALAARLALGAPLDQAARQAVAYVAALLAASADHHLGHGRGPLLHGSRRF